MQKIMTFLFIFFSSQLISENCDLYEYFIRDHCEMQIDECSEKLTHCYASDFCEWYYIYGQMNAYEDVLQLLQIDIKD